MTLSRFLRDFLYIPLGGNRGGRLKTYRNLFITMLLGGLWHGAAWTFVLWGAFHGAGLSPSTRSRGRVSHCRPGCAGSSRSTWSCSAWILFRLPDLERAGEFLSRLVDPGRRDAVDARRSSPAIVVVIGLQLLPRAAGRGAADPARAAPARAARRRPRRRGPVRRRHRPRARASPRSSTSASDMTTPIRRQPDEPLRRSTACAASARATRSSRSRSCALLLVLFEGASIRGAGEQMDPGIGRDVVLPVGKPAGWIARPAAARATPPTTRRRGCRPTTTSTRRGRFADAGGAAAAPGPAGHRRRVRPRRARRRSPRRRGRCARCSSPATRCPRRLTRSWRAGSGRTRRRGRPRPAPRHRHLEELPRRLGPAVGRAGPQARARRRRRLHRRQRGLPAARSRTAQRSSAAAPTGRPRTPTACGAMMNTYRAEGAGARLLGHAADAARPRPRSGSAASSTPRSTSPPQPWRAQVRVIDTCAIFTPEGYRDAMAVDGDGDDRPRARRHPPQRGRGGRARRRAVVVDRPGSRLRFPTMRTGREKRDTMEPHAYSARRAPSPPRSPSVRGRRRVGRSRRPTWRRPARHPPIRAPATSPR